MTQNQRSVFLGSYRITGHRFLCLAILFCLLFAFSSQAFSKIATEDEMDKVCRNWLTQIVKATGNWAGVTNPEILTSQDVYEDNILLGRFYTISPKGFILVPTLRELAPVKAYSDESTMDIFEEGGMAQMLRQVLSSRMELFTEVYGSVEAEQSGSEPLFTEVNKDNWNLYAVSEKKYAQSLNKGLSTMMAEAGPLLTTSWSQGSPYNALCPMGDGGRCVVGCVATAAAQILYYHQWPPAGEGSHTYRWAGDKSCKGSTPSQDLTADFSDPYTYDNSYASVAEISYEMGVAYEMIYGACASGAYTDWGEWLLPQYFRYDQSAESIDRSSYSQSAWFIKIKGNINMGRPTLYTIYSHAIVCDGWREVGMTQQYHFNYGWGGSRNAWYNVDGLHCPWDGCDPMKESMVHNIIPLNGVPWMGDNTLSDATGGDGDNILEGGETIEMTVSIINYGGAIVNDVAMSIAFDDLSLNVIEGDSYYGSIDHFDTSTNTADPFVFEIPADYTPRIDSCFIELTWEGGNVDSMAIEIQIGQVAVLLVDDDILEDYEKYYMACLDSCRMPYDWWMNASYFPPTGTDLADYDIVFWFTGDDRTNPLSSADIAAMSDYLDGGGNLFLTGQGIASQLSVDDPTFLNDYLKTNFEAKVHSPFHKTAATTTIFNTGDTLFLMGADGANNQTNTERITPANGGIGELDYISGDHYSAVSYSGTAYKSVFFAFGFEAIHSTNPRYFGRYPVFSDILDFFGGIKPSPPPLVLDPTASPGDLAHMTEHTPDLSWTYFDEGTEPQTYYWVQVGQNTKWSTIEMWDTGPILSTDTSILYSGAELLDGFRYFVRIRVCNSTFWSNWNEFYFTMNAPPRLVEGMSPTGMEPVSSLSSNFLHDRTTDPDGSPVITYNYELYGDEAMTSLIASDYDQTSTTNPVLWQPSLTLSEDEDYYWRVRADDDLEVGLWTELSSFFVNASNQPPADFELAYPPDGTLSDNLLPTFHWNKSIDPDPHDQIVYMLTYADNPNFAAATRIRQLTDTLFTLQYALNLENDYYWKVAAADRSNIESASLATWKYMTMIYGDANGDRFLNLGDAIYIINYIFKGGNAPVPLASGDANCDDKTNLGDAIHLINYIFKGGPMPGCSK